MSNENAKFLRILEEIKSEVNRRAGTQESHGFNIHDASRNDNIVQRNRDILEYARNIRNVLAHPNYRSDGDAVHVSDNFFNEVQALLDRLRNPPAANSVACHSRRSGSPD